VGTDAREELREHIETAEQERAAYITAVNLRAAQLHGQIEGLKAALALLTNGAGAEVDALKGKATPPV